MNKKSILIGIAILITLTGVQVFAAQQANDYRAYVSSPFIDEDIPAVGNNATMVMKVTYVPVYASQTYTLTAGSLAVVVDMSKPTSINGQIATAVKNRGNTLGYNVIRVFVPSYEMIIP